MRHPSTTAKLYAWHRAAIKGENPNIHESDPQCGWYKTQLSKKGPYVPARIFVKREIDPATGELVSDEQLICEIEGIERDAFREWIWLAKNPISKSEFDALRETVRQHDFMRATHKKVDLSKEAIRP